MNYDIEEVLQQLGRDVDVIQEELTALRPDISGEHTVGAYFVERIELALECAAGCNVLARAGLAFPMGAISRTMLEMMIKAFWATSTQERALDAAGADFAETMRILRMALKDKHGLLKDAKIGNDQTDALLNELQKSLPPRKTVAQLARECGLEKVYDLLYTTQSLPIHGHTAGMMKADEREATLYSTVECVHTYLKAIYFIITKFIYDAEATTLLEIDNILRMDLVESAALPSSL